MKRVITYLVITIQLSGFFVLAQQSEEENDQEDQEVEIELKLPEIETAEEYEYQDCRQCLDNYSNSYFCKDISNNGYCCPFLDSTVGIGRFEPIQCAHSPTLGQVCSHRVDAQFL